MKKIVTLTMNPALDTSTSVHLVVSDYKLRCKAPRHDPGGGGVNVSRAIHRLGGDSLAVYVAGGPTGQLLRELLDREGVRQLPLPIEAWTREDLYVMEEATARQYRFIMPGAPLQEREWIKCLDQLAGLPDKPDYLVASGSLPPGVPDDFFARLARVTKALGSRFVLDTSGPPLRLALQEGVYLAKPNLHEMSDLAGEELPDEPHQSRAALRLAQSKRAEIVVLSLGASGAILATAEGTQRLTSPSVRALSRVGAGDSMLGGLVLGLARGMTLSAAVRYGIAAGAAAVVNPGTQLCAAEDTERLFSQTT